MGIAPPVACGESWPSAAVLPWTSRSDWPLREPIPDGAPSLGAGSEMAIRELLIPAGDGGVVTARTLACGENEPSAAASDWTSHGRWPLRELSPAGESSVGNVAPMAGRESVAITPLPA